MTVGLRFSVYIQDTSSSIPVAKVKPDSLNLARKEGRKEG